MKLVNQLLNYKFHNYEYIALILFVILPVSFIFGNAFVNLNIILLNLLALFYCFKFKYWKWLKKDIFLYLIIFYAYLLLNSIYAHFFKFYEYNDGLLRSLFFIKFILLVLSFQTLLKNKIILSLVYKSWFLIISIFIFDVLFEKIFGQNILGNISPDGTRIVSFFKDELVVGAFLFCFGFTTITYFLSQNNNGYFKIIVTVLLILIPIAVFLSGERSNFIKSFILFFFIVIFIETNKIYLNRKLLFSIFISLIVIFLLTTKYTFGKYSELFYRIQAAEKNSNFYQKFENIKYFAHYETAISIFKNNPILGVGSKNFRHECKNEEYYRENIKFTKSRCSTHPHQIHFEILSEQGLLGYLLILFIMIFFLKENLKFYFKTRNIYHLSSIIYLILFFVPILPGGGIFSTFSGSMFWIIFAICNLNYENQNS